MWEVIFWKWEICFKHTCNDILHVNSKLTLYVFENWLNLFEYRYKIKLKDKYETILHGIIS